MKRRQRLPLWGIVFAVAMITYFTYNKQIRALHLPQLDLSCEFEEDNRKFDLYKGNYGSIAQGSGNVAVHLAVIKEITGFQKKNCIFGSIGEIGVHHGKFLLGMSAFSRDEEPIVAIDLFDDQHLNVDSSGKGSKVALIQASSRSGMLDSQLTLIQADSLTLSTKSFATRGIPQFRLFSVDGGHTRETTFHDLSLASTLLTDGGIVILDDFIHMTWIGVLDGMADFVKSQEELVPFLWICSKLYFVDRKWHQRYFDLVKQMPCVKCTGSSGIHPSRYSLGGWRVCIDANEQFCREDLNVTTTKCSHTSLTMM